MYLIPESCATVTIFDPRCFLPYFTAHTKFIAEEPPKNNPSFSIRYRLICNTSESVTLKASSMEAAKKLVVGRFSPTPSTTVSNGFLSL